MPNEGKDVKERATAFFKKHKSVKCPAFSKEKVYFNSKGLEHLFYKGKRKTRKPKQSRIRVELLPRAFVVLKKLPLFQEERSFENKEGELVHYWAFEGVVEQRRIKVIVRQVGKGRKHFWSVIPSWKSLNGLRINAKSLFWKE